MTLDVSIQDVLDAMAVDAVDGVPNAGKYADHIISSNIRTAHAKLEHDTHRVFTATEDVTRKYSSNGAAFVEIRDCRGVSSVTLSGGTRTLDTDAWLIPDPNHPEIFVAIQTRPVGGNNYRAYSDWFDTNKDTNAYWRDGRLPNDLVLVQDEGWDPYPEEFLAAKKVLAAWYTKRPDSLLANVAQTPEGTVLDYSALPPEVSGFIQGWARGPILTVIDT